MNISPSGLAWEACQKVILIVPRVASEVMVKSWMLVRDAVRFTPGASPSRLSGRTGRDWGQEEKGTTEDGMAGWHHGLDGRESE